MHLRNRLLWKAKPNIGAHAPCGPRGRGRRARDVRPPSCFDELLFEPRGFSASIEPSDRIFTLKKFSKSCFNPSSQKSRGFYLEGSCSHVTLVKTMLWLNWILQNQITEKDWNRVVSFRARLGLGLVLGLVLELVIRVSFSVNSYPNPNLTPKLTTRFQSFLGNLILKYDHFGLFT